MADHHSATWAPQEVVRVTKLWVEDGLSYGEIAKVMGKTRNAVLSKINRLKLPPRLRVHVTKDAVAKPIGFAGQPKVNAIVNAATARARIAPPPFEREPFDPETDVGIDVTSRVGLMGLNNHTWRWPVGHETGARQMFCGCHVAIGPYCPGHTAKAEVRR